MVTRSTCRVPEASSSASSRRSRSDVLSGLYGSKVGSFQYVSKVARNFSSKLGVATLARRTFHSTPSSSAARDRFDDPTYAVSYPVARANNQALACSRVRTASYWIFTCAPKSRTKRSSAVRSVAPMYVVVMTRNGAPRCRRRVSSGSRTLSPNHFTKAHSRSTASEESISARSSAPSEGSPDAFVSRAASESGVLGRTSCRVARPGRGDAVMASS
jgi:hypothetical protein